MQQAQRYLSNFAAIYDFFRYDQHKLKAVNHRLLRERSLDFWQSVAINPSASA